MKILLFLFLISTCAFSETTLRIGLSSEVDTLHPILASSSAAKYSLFFGSRLWTYLDGKNIWQPQLVKKIPNLKDKSLQLITEKGKRKMRAHWEFADGLKWGDGTPISCKDAQFTWEVGRHENTSSDSREGYNNIESIEWDPKTPTHCVITYVTQKWNFYIDSHYILLPAHLEEPIFQKWKNEKQGYERNSLYVKDPTQPGLWNGPYRVSEFKLGSHIIFVSNTNYGGPAPKINKIVLKMISNNGTLEAQLNNSEIDAISRIGLSLDQAIELENKIKSTTKPYQVVYADGVMYAHIDFNLDDPVLSSLSIRKALSHAINKDAFIKSIFEDRVTPATTVISPTDSLNHVESKAITVYKFDKKKARKILDQAGWKLGDDGFRYKNKQKLSLLLVGLASVKQIQTLQLLLQADWKSIGVDVEIKTEPARLFFSETLKKRKFQMGLYSWGAFPGFNPGIILHSQNIPTEGNAWSGQNLTGFKNPKVDAWTDQYDSELSETERKKLVQNIMKAYTEIIPTIPLYFRKENAVIPKNLKNFELFGHSFFESLAAEKWVLE